MGKRKKNFDGQGLEAGAGANLQDVSSKNTKTVDKTGSQNLETEIKKTVKGLYYTSESDAKILPFTGVKADAVTAENLLNQIKADPNTQVEERDFTEFFAQLTAIQDWFGDEEKETAAKFGALRDLLMNNLNDLKVFKVGQTELDIYIVGLDADGILKGATTKAVET